MHKKWLPLTIVLGIAGAAVVTAGLWPGGEKKPPAARTLCSGALSRETAELIDDGKGGEVSAEEWGSKGKGTDEAVFKTCGVMRADPGGDSRRGIFNLVIADERRDSGPRKDSVPLGSGFKGWALPEQARAVLPEGCAARMGSTAPYITVTFLAPSKEGEEQKEGLVDRDTAIRNSAAIVREAATNLARIAGCA
ncbi:hypothetical protein ACIQRS_03555 [Streptomyces termitum]|uniref:Uncharacterized protein n=1 Tax=Streptomyces termitum TaxID=67368 RepID=A0A918T3R6_9ACTN|nr:hypothetical protein [Streptomyces termitum]GHA88198.1 hypothetical protein GCM10010305_34770 [Streptomyces termitum]